MLMARVGLGVALAGLLVLADPVCGQGEDVKSEQRVLRDAGLPTDGPGLVNFLRKQIPSKVDEVRIASIVERLGDKSFAAREKASREIVAAGSAALPALRRALGQRDAELVRRARECIAAIEKSQNPAALAAAAYILKVRKPEGALAVLLDYLPHAADAAVKLQIQVTLFVLGREGGKVRPEIVAALKDPAVERRAVAAFLLGQSGTPEQRQMVWPLLDDKEFPVRWQAAIGLVAAGEKRALPALVGFLESAPFEQALEAEELLRKIAGDLAPKAALEENAAARKLSGVAWTMWLKEHGDKLNLKAIDSTQLLADSHGRIRKTLDEILAAFRKGDFHPALKRLEDKLWIDGTDMFNTRQQFEELMRLASMQPDFQKQLAKLTYKVELVLPIEDYLRRYPNEKLKAFMAKHRAADIRAVRLRVFDNGAAPPGGTGYVFVRLAEGDLKILGFGSGK